MKKLISELETKLNSESVQWCNHEFSDGFKCAIEVVKTHNPWISVEELPPKQANCSYSIDVLVRDGTSKPFTVAYYSYEQNKWKWEYDFSCDVTHWAYLPEVQNA